MQLVALIPLALHEVLLPSEVGDVVEIAAFDKEPIETVCVRALREYIANHKPPMVQQDLGLAGT